MKLEIKHLAEYLPHDLKIMFEGDDNVHSLVGVDITDRGAHVISPYKDYGHARIEDCRPVLRPLSDLTKPITHNGETFVPYKKLGWDYYDGELGEITYCIYGESPRIAINVLDYIGDYHRLLEWHFDVFGLIPAGIAIDLKTVKQ